MTGERNLRPRRGPDVWERGRTHARRTRRAELWAMGLGGGALVAFGLWQRRRALPAALGSLAGGALLYRAVVGYDDIADARCWFSNAYARLTSQADDQVQHESEQSFPASDVPSWTPTGGARAETTV